MLQSLGHWRPGQPFGGRAKAAITIKWCYQSTQAQCDPTMHNQVVRSIYVPLLSLVALFSVGLAHGPDRVATHYLSDKRDGMLQ